MGTKEIRFGDNARSALKRGVDAVADAVRVTIGPRGRNVILEQSYGAPMVTNDGVSIAKDIELKDKFENMGAEIIKEVATKTNDVAGDGTTTASILAQAIFSEGLLHMSKGANPMGVRRGIEKASEDAVKGLREIAVPVKSKEEIRQVATISAESSDIGKIIGDTIDKVGENGVVTVEESQSLGIDSEVVEGLEFDKGYVSPYMITRPDRMEAEYKEAPILITDKKVSTIKEILPLLESLAQSGTKELVIIADDVDGEALTTFVLNRLRGGFSVLAVKAPGYGDRKKEMLEDIAIVTGGTLVSEEVGIKLENADTSVLGRARRIVATKDKTTIIGGKGKKSALTERVEQLKAQLAQTDSKYDKEKLEERIGKLTGGVAVIRVGAPTETEMKYLKLKIEDAVNATKAAIEEGIIPGGGSALIKVSKKLESKELENEDENTGYGIVVRALEAPLKQIVLNAGLDDAAVVVDKVRKGGKTAGYDAVNDEVVADMFKTGIIDPLKVARSAVQNASSAAAILLTTEVAIADFPEPEKAEHNHPEMGGM